MPPEDSGEWAQYRRLVMSKLESIEERLDNLDDRLEDLEEARVAASVRWSIAAFVAATLVSTGTAALIQFAG